MMKKVLLILFVLTAVSSYASFEEGQKSINASILEAKKELSELRENIGSEKIPLSKKLSALESEVTQLRRDAERQQRLSDAGGMDINALEANLKARQEEVDYITSLMTEFLTGIETRSAPSELNLYREQLDSVLVSIDNPDLDQSSQFERQLKGIEIGLERLEELVGGRKLVGKAVLEDGSLVEGDFLLFGPVSYFSAGSPEKSGVSMRGDTDIPVVVSVQGGGATISEAVAAAGGVLPVDPTLGKAIAIASTDETLIEHILKGGVWIFPILFAAAISMAIAMFKALEIFSIKQVSPGKIREIVSLLREDEKKKALHVAKDLPKPTGELVLAGVENCHEPKELLEEIMLEKIVEAQPKVERLLPVIAVTAATAPLLGLLGTVTGMINTFKLITIFGTGDAKSLSSGISEALITTEFGLIVAIPSLILHAILNRRAKGILAGLETTGMRFINGISAGKSADKTNS